MKHLRLTLFASAAIGLATIVSASAAPAGITPALNESSTQNVRLVCDQWGRCYETRRNRHRGYNNRHRGYDDGYYRQRRGYGFGPFGFF